MHHSLLISMDVDSISMEAQRAIDTLRKSSLAEPVIQSDNGSSFIAMEFKHVLRENHLTQKLIRPHTQENNAIVERANKTMRESWYLSYRLITNRRNPKSPVSFSTTITKEDIPHCSISHRYSITGAILKYSWQ
ncbi:hypothetical protein [Thermoplasma volcanium GSS1]|uniref:Integrase catalytic domain-containing protein n=1 Tax=Thermoplasma volcanium (strain ATCC 51530 / DSM 4299 / JCM 9571 / NBRC 15438 / GSS1) TaxID=273116 RepID=Q97AD0_THEVO|nr:hypothetical protein [Thermoplasma volcanium GSS1]